MKSTVINSTEFLITSDRDEAIEGFYAEGNEKLDFLPTNLGDKFPNLINLHARNCSIKAISKENFEGLDKLRRLNLAGNQIKKIADDTFDSIPSVENIWLSE